MRKAKSLLNQVEPSEETPKKKVESVQKYVGSAQNPTIRFEQVQSTRSDHQASERETDQTGAHVRELV